MAASSGEISHGFTKVPEYSWHSWQKRDVSKTVPNR